MQEKNESFQHPLQIEVEQELRSTLRLPGRLDIQSGRCEYNICWFSELLDRFSKALSISEEHRLYASSLRIRYVESSVGIISEPPDLIFRQAVNEVCGICSSYSSLESQERSFKQESEITPPLFIDFDSIVTDEINASLSEKAEPTRVVRSLDFSNSYLTDEDLEVIFHDSDREYAQVNAINLAGNQLSDSCVCQVLSRAIEAGSELTVLDVSENQGITYRLILYISDLVRSLRLNQLRSISVAGIHLAGPRMAELLNNLSTSTTPCLETLNLSNTRLGMRDDVASEALSFTLSQIRQLTHLDVSHNFLREKHLTKIGESLALMDSIQILNVSHNAGGKGSLKLPAIASLCSVLGSVASLHSVHLEHTDMNDPTAFILADSLSVHPRIRHIDLSGNSSISIFGIQALLRLVLFREAGAESINLNNSFCHATRHIFNFSDPTGRYALDMGDLVHKAIARQCFRSWEKSGQAFEKTFKAVEVDAKPFKPEKDDENVWQLPDQGILRFSTIFRIYESDGSLSKIAEDHVVTDNMMQRFTRGVYAKIRSTDNKQAVIKSISESFVYDCDISQIVQYPGNSGHLTSLILQALLPKVKDPLRVIASNQAVFVKLRRPFRRILPVSVSSELISFNPVNPTGHYRFNLDDPLNKSIAVELFERARHEHDGFKESLYFQVIKNCTLNGSKLESISKSNVPDTGVLEFDYISPSRSGNNRSAGTVSPHDWTDFITKFSSAFSAKIEHINCRRILRELSSDIEITSAQLVDLLTKFPDAVDFKCDIAVTLLRRVSDYPNLKELMCRDRLGIPSVFTADSVQHLERRVGKLALFNPLKLENTANDCDLANEEDRCIALTILTLLAKEKGSRVVNSKIGETKESAVAMSPPKAWYTSLPDFGWWSCTYVVDEKGINTKLRKELAVSLCGYDKRTIEP